MKVGYLITARLKSTRLPNKLLRIIKGKPILAHMIDRLKLAKKVDHIIICTSANKQDEPLFKLAEENDIGCYAGNPDDVIARLSGAAEENQLDYVLNITGDCPFADPVYADKIVTAYQSTNADLIRAFGLPHGAFSYGIKPSALKKIIDIKDSSETEVWGRYFTDTDLFKTYDLPITNPLHQQPGLRMTLDYPEDLAFFEAVFDQLYEKNRVFSLDEILLLLQKKSEIVELNRHCAGAFLKRFNSQAAIHLKPRYQVKKAAIIGSGSIGQRHIRNLIKLGITDIVALRSKKGYHQNIPSEFGVHEVSEWQELIERRPDIAIVSNPTSMHMGTVLRLLPYVKGILVEKPLGKNNEKSADFLTQVQESNVILYVGYNLVFHKAIQVVRDFLSRSDIGEPLSFQTQVGHWLPDWHPYEDFQKAYYAREELGGGVLRTLSHEIHLAQYLFGKAASICGITSPSDLLSLDTDTIADIMIRHQSGVVSQLHLDYIQRPIHRTGVISCEKGWIQYDLVNNMVWSQTNGQTETVRLWEDDKYDANQQYIDEMSTFLRFVREGRTGHDFDARAGIHIMSILDAAFISAKHGVMKTIEEPVPLSHLG